MKMVYGLLLIVTITMSFATDRYAFSNARQRAQFEHLLKDMRCMVCSHQNLAESSAALAMDMKKVIYRQVLDGQSDQDIISFMTARYGDVILFKPPVKSTTYFLWFAPLILLLIGALMFKKMVFRVAKHD